MNRLKQWWQNYQKRNKENRKNAIRERVDVKYDVGVYLGELWLFIDGVATCPMSMFKDSNVCSVINAIRCYRYTIVEKTKNNYAL